MASRLRLTPAEDAWWPRVVRTAGVLAASLIAVGRNTDTWVSYRRHEASQGLVVRLNSMGGIDITPHIDSPLATLNRDALCAQWGLTLPVVHPCDGENVSFGETPQGSSATSPIRVRTGDGRWLQVHGRRPLDEADAWLTSAVGTSGMPEVICIIGAGAGWIVDAIERRSPTTRVLVLEPEPRLAAALLARRDWRPLIAARRLLLLQGPEFHGADGAWRIVSPSAEEPARLVHPVIAQAFPETAAAAARVYGRAVRESKANEEARRRFEVPYLVNTLANLPTILRAADVAALRGVHGGRPVVVAAAGPSLNRNIEELRPHRPNVVLIAVDTALRPLLLAGIEPDYVVAVDPQEANARHFLSLPPHHRVVLVAEASVSPSALRPFEGRTCVFRVDRHVPWPWLARTGVDVGVLRAFGSVTTSAFDLALHIGGDPVILLGADLAYTNSQTYCRGTSYEGLWLDREAAGTSLHDQWEEAIQSRGPVVCAGIDGAPVRSSSTLLAFRDWLVDASRYAAVRVVNATGAGVLTGGAIETPAAGAWTALLETAEPVLRDEPVPTRRAALVTNPSDAHLLRCLGVGVTPPSAGVVQFERLDPLERIARTRALRERRGTDTERWAASGTHDPWWPLRASRALRAAAHIPAGSRVLDVGAGTQILRALLPEGCHYTPADLFAFTPDTLVVDLNATAFPRGDWEVVVMLGVWEYVHAVRRTLECARVPGRRLVTSYTARTGGTEDDRLRNGWVNDYDLPGFLSTVTSAGWSLETLEELNRADTFVQWLLVVRASDSPSPPH